MDSLLRGEAGLTIQRARLRTILSQLAPRKHRARFIPRRIYFVRFPLSTIHLDGNHKLVR